MCEAQEDDVKGVLLKIGTDLNRLDLDLLRAIEDELVPMERLDDVELSDTVRQLVELATRKAEIGGSEKGLTEAQLVWDFGRSDEQKNALWFVSHQFLQHSDDVEPEQTQEWADTHVYSLEPPPGWATSSVVDLFVRARAISQSTTPSERGRVHGRHLVAAFILRAFEQPSPLRGCRELLDLYGIQQRPLIDDYLEWLADAGTGDAVDPWLAVFGRGSEPAAAVPRIAVESPQGDDLIGIEADVNALASVIASQNLVPPLAVGLFGDWGAGKSFFMEKLKTRIDLLARGAAVRQERRDPCAFHSRVAQIWFNAWNYAEANLWASLVTHIFEELHDWFAPKTPAAAKQWQWLLDNLDKASALRVEAKEDLSAAQRELEEARERERVVKKDLTDRIGQLWSDVAKRDFGEPLRKVEQTLDIDQLNEVKETLLLRREEAESLVERLSLLRRTFAKGLVSPRALGAFGFAMIALLAVVFGGVYWLGDERLDAISGQIASSLTIIGSASAWLGTALKRRREWSTP